MKNIQLLLRVTHVRFTVVGSANSRVPSLFPQLSAPMPIMIWIAVVIEAAIMNWADMGILLGIQFINATLGWWGSWVECLHVGRAGGLVRERDAWHGEIWRLDMGPKAGLGPRVQALGVRHLYLRSD